MPIHTRITYLARERGYSAAEIAKQLGLYPSNISAMDSGRRSFSIKLLIKLSELLNVSPIDLLAVGSDFEESRFSDRIVERETIAQDGKDRAWVHNLQLAWRKHYKSVRPQK